MRRISIARASTLTFVLLLASCASAQQSAYYPSEFRAGVAQSYDEEDRHAKYTTFSVEFRWPLKPAPVRDVSRPSPSPAPTTAATPVEKEPLCSQQLPE